MMKSYFKYINLLGYAIIQLPEFLLKITNYMGKMSSKMTDRSHDEISSELNYAQKIAKQNHGPIVEDQASNIMLKLKRFEIRVNRRLEAMESEMIHVLCTQNK